MPEIKPRLSHPVEIIEHRSPSRAPAEHELKRAPPRARDIYTQGRSKTAPDLETAFKTFTERSPVPSEPTAQLEHINSFLASHNSASATHQASEKNRAQLIEINKFVDQAYANRDNIGRARDLFSGILGTSNATRAYRAAKEHIKDMHSDFQSRSVSHFENQTESLFHTTYLPPAVKESVGRLAQENPQALEKLNDMLEQTQSIVQDTSLNAEKKSAKFAESTGPFMNELSEAFANESISAEDYQSLLRFSTSDLTQLIALGNIQFHLDHIPHLLESKDNAKQRTGRAYNEIDRFQEMLDGKTDISTENLALLQKQQEAMQKVSEEKGYGTTSWITGDDPLLGIQKHSGWIHAELPPEEGTGIFKATRTLGLAQGTKVEMGEVTLDFSELGEVSKDQATQLLKLTQDYGDQNAATGETDESKAAFLTRKVKELSGFTPELQAEAGKIVKAFAEGTTQKIDALHANLSHSVRAA